MTHYFYDAAKLSCTIRGNLIYDVETGSKIGQIDDCTLIIDDNDHSERLIINMRINRYNRDSLKRDAELEKALTKLDNVREQFTYDYLNKDK